MDWEAAEARWGAKLAREEARAVAEGRCDLPPGAGVELMAYARGGEGRLVRLRRALDLGGDPNLTVKVDGAMMPLLAHAVEKGDAEAVEMLLAAGADVGKVGGGAQGVLVAGIRCKSARLARAALGAGAQLTEAGGGAFGDESGLSPLSRAVAGRDEAMVSELLALGAAPNWGGGANMLPPLHMAARRGDGALCGILIQGGADVDRVSNYVDESGKPARGTAAELSRSRGRLAVAGALEAMSLARAEREALSAQAMAAEGGGLGMKGKPRGRGL